MRLKIKAAKEVNFSWVFDPMTITIMVDCEENEALAKELKLPAGWKKRVISQEEQVDEARGNTHYPRLRQVEISTSLKSVEPKVLRSLANSIEEILEFLASKGLKAEVLAFDRQ